MPSSLGRFQVLRRSTSRRKSQHPRMSQSLTYTLTLEAECSKGERHKWPLFVLNLAFMALISSLEGLHKSSTKDELVAKVETNNSLNFIRALFASKRPALLDVWGFRLVFV